MKPSPIFIIFFFITFSGISPNKYEENFDNDNVWRYLYDPNQKINIHNQAPANTITQQMLEQLILARDFDKIFQFISSVKSPGECYSDFQQIIHWNGQLFESESFFKLGEGKTGSVFYFKGNAIKMMEVNKIGESSIIQRYAHKERNLKYFIREMNTGNIIMNSYLSPQNELSNITPILNTCVEKSVKVQKRSENEVTYKIFVMMPYFPLSLRDVIDQNKPNFESESFFFPWKLKLLDGILMGVYWIHHNGYAHRDLKPSNILLSEGGIPLISDFGFSKKFSEETSSVLGSPVYMAPEIRHESGSYTHKVDVFSLGIIIFEVLTLHARVNVQTMTTHDIHNYCLSNEFPYLSVERNIKEIYCSYFHFIVVEMTKEKPGERPELIQVIREWIRFRMTAEQADLQYDQSLYARINSMDSTQFNGNFLDGLQDQFKSNDDAMDIEMLGNSQAWGDSHIENQSANNLEFMYLKVSGVDPSFSKKCVVLFDILKEKFSTGFNDGSNPQVGIYRMI